LIFIKESPCALGQTEVMQRFLNSLFCLVLAFALALTSPGGVGPTKGALLIELCAEDSTSLVWIDAEGNPIEPGGVHSKCLDCLLFAAHLPNIADGLLTLAPLPLASGLSLPVPPPTHPIAHLHPIPRGPPVAESKVLRHGSPRPDTRFLHLLVTLLIDSNQVVSPAGVADPRAAL
jgi:hypothetical protein